jgi:fatty acid-binding protein DegV
MCIRDRAVTALAQHVAEKSREHGRLRVALMHAALDVEERELETALTAAGADIEIVSRGVIGAVIGTYTGPGTVGVAYHPIG